MRPLVTPIAIACLLLVAHTNRCGAIVVDGRLDASYTLLSTQAAQASPGPDATSGAVDFAAGSELDAAYGAVDGGVLYLFLAGNLKDTICASQTCADFGDLEVFIDSQPGGQNTLLIPQGPALLGGLTFDAGFAPDYRVNFQLSGALSGSFIRYAEYFTLPTGGGGTGTGLGYGTNTGAPGTLGGGTNPFGIQATVDNGNTGGVGAGCGAASGAGVTTGMELAIPLAAIGNPTGCITVSAFVFEPQGAYLTNQVLGPVPAGTCAFGVATSVNFANVPGDQFFSLCLDTVPVHGSSWGALKSHYR